MAGLGGIRALLAARAVSAARPAATSSRPAVMTSPAGWKPVPSYSSAYSDMTACERCHHFACKGQVLDRGAPPGHKDDHYGEWLCRACETCVLSSDRQVPFPDASTSRERIVLQKPWLSGSAQVAAEDSQRVVTASVNEGWQDQTPDEIATAPDTSDYDAALAPVCLDLLHEPVLEYPSVAWVHANLTA
jgi:hypothetical protein